MKFGGASTLRIDVGGNLRVHDSVRFSKPTIYQKIDGERVFVPGSFHIDGGEISFRTGAYRRDLPLIIDPVLSYSSYRQERRVA
jgi:hypothetical protein